MGRPYQCPFCKSTRSISKGVRRTKTLGIRHLRICKNCGRKFTPRNQKAVPSGVRRRDSASGGGRSNG